jgi:hypothetical protein
MSQLKMNYCCCGNYLTTDYYIFLLHQYSCDKAKEENLQQQPTTKSHTTWSNYDKLS